MSEHEPVNGNGGVRITNREIYDLLVKVDGRVGSVEQTLRENIRPDLARHEEALKAKADRSEVVAIAGRTEKLEMRVYAVLAGLIAGGVSLNGLGVI